MFTGIIEAIGRVKAVERTGRGARLAVAVELPNNDLKIGDSVAVNGVCLTVTSLSGNTFQADVGAESFEVTTLGRISEGANVNVERPMQLGGRLGGHLMQGHVDGIGKILNINKLGSGVEVELEVSSGLSRYIVNKGSIAIDGVSLTVSTLRVDSQPLGLIRFKVFLIPHTVESTIFKYAKAGQTVNLEVDIIGKYVEKLVRPDSGEGREPSRITEEFLREHGF